MLQSHYRGVVKFVCSLNNASEAEIHISMDFYALFTWLNPLRILERMPVQASIHATKWLQTRSVEMILGERVTDWNHSTTSGCSVCLRTDQGRLVEGDVLYKAIGFSRCSQLMYPDAEGKSNNPPPIQVEPTLQVASSCQFSFRVSHQQCLSNIFLYWQCLVA